jgi:glycerol-3-phosphate dehydrogenase
VVLENDSLPNDTGMILNNTSDGRLIFILPYLGYMLVGTTDDMQDVEMYPEASDKDVEFLKNEMKRTFGENFDFDGKLRSKFAGLRPLCLETPLEQSEYAEKVKKLKSKEICRSHVIEVVPSGLVSLLGGKWTSYRIMGEEAIDAAIKAHKFKDLTSEKSKAFQLKHLGCYSKMELKESMVLGTKEIATKYKNQMVFLYDIPLDVADKLIEKYGVASLRIVKHGTNVPAYGSVSKSPEDFKSANVRLHPDLPILESELYHHMDNELAVRPDDIINRRL